MWRFKDLNDWRRCLGTIEAAFSPAPGVGVYKGAGK